MTTNEALVIADFRVACVYEAARLEKCNCWACVHNRLLTEALAVLTGLAERCKELEERNERQFLNLALVNQENERLLAGSNGKHWQGIAQIAALQTENAALKDTNQRYWQLLQEQGKELERARPLLAKMKEWGGSDALSGRAHRGVR
jgi:hypothetical protein